MQLLHRSWHRTWTGVGARGDGASLMAQLVGRYSESHRSYHTLQHLGECIEHFEGAAAVAERAAEVEVALWFHDAIYELRSSDNERQSANWARKELVEAGAATESAERVHALVLATRHAALPVTRDEQLLVDIDLSILGAPPWPVSTSESTVLPHEGMLPGRWLSFSAFLFNSLKAVGMWAKAAAVGNAAAPSRWTHAQHHRCLRASGPGLA